MKKTIFPALLSAVILVSCGGAAKQHQECADGQKDCCKKSRTQRKTAMKKSNG